MKSSSKIHVHDNFISIFLTWISCAKSHDTNFRWIIFYVKFMWKIEHDSAYVNFMCKHISMPTVRCLVAFGIIINVGNMQRSSEWKEGSFYMKIQMYLAWVHQTFLDKLNFVDGSSIFRNLTEPNSRKQSKFNSFWSSDNSWFSYHISFI